MMSVFCRVGGGVRVVVVVVGQAAAPVCVCNDSDGVKLARDNDECGSEVAWGPSDDGDDQAPSEERQVALR